MRGDEGQTLGIYIVAVFALFFLAFAFFAVGQASVRRNSAQTAADAAALAAARQARDDVKDAFLAALTAGDLARLTGFLNGTGIAGPADCSAADTYAANNDADVTTCEHVYGPPGYAVAVRTRSTVGTSVVSGTENIKATSRATAVVEPRCTADSTQGTAVLFTCAGRQVTVDPTVNGFQLNLAEFFIVHLSK